MCLYVYVCAMSWIKRSFESKKNPPAVIQYEYEEDFQDEEWVCKIFHDFYNTADFLTANIS